MKYQKLRPIVFWSQFFILLDYLKSDIEIRGKGFHAVVLAPLRLISISDILGEVEEK